MGVASTSLEVGPDPSEEGSAAAASPGPRAPAVGPLAGLALFVLVAALCFNGGGYYAGTTGVAAAVVAFGLCARTALVRRPFAGLGLATAVVGAIFALLTLFTLASLAWSDAPARAIIEYNRTLLYVLVLVGFASVPRTPERLRWLVYGMTAAAVVVCLAGLVSRLAPDVWPVERNILNERLSFPLTYWNALALVAAVGCILGVHLASSVRERMGVRLAGSFVVPLMAAALLLTFSRAGIAVALGGIIAYLAVARPRGAVGASLALIPAVGYAVAASLDADLLARPDPTTRAAIEQGHELALVLAACALGAATLRLATLPLDGIVSRWLAPARRRRWARVAGGVVALGCVAGAVAAGAVGQVEQRIQSFADSDPVDLEDTALRNRLTRSGGEFRTLFWSHSLDQLAAHPLRGSGAGTFHLTWQQGRPAGTERQRVIAVVDGHSLYTEMAGELGWTGLLMLVVGLVAILGRFAWLARGPDRAVGAALMAAGLAWVVHAGFDWDWETPGVTVWLFAFAGLALARPLNAAHARESPGPRWPVRAVVALVFAAASVLPAQMALSQRHLDRSSKAFRANDCATALPAARKSITALGLRPEPRMIAAVCQIRAGREAEALRLIASARRRDPRNWAVHYTEGLIRATAGRDPRAAIRRARALNPGDPFTIEASAALRGGNRSTWRRRGPELPLPER
jgi:O-antigen ligase